MDFNRLTTRAQEAVRAADAVAKRHSHQQIDVEHVLAALLDQQGGLVPAVLEREGVNVQQLKRRVDAELDRMPKVHGSGPGLDQIYVTQRFNQLIARAEDEAKPLKDEYVCSSRWATTARARRRGSSSPRRGSRARA